jgi:hypothetical protein
MQSNPSASTAPRGRAANHSSNTLHPMFERQSINVSTMRSPSSPAHMSHPSPSSSPYQSNMNAVQISRRRIEAERAALRQRMRKDIQRQQNELRRHKEFLEKTKIWEEQIIPNWDTVMHTNKVRDLCLKGIPPTIRAKVWPLLVGNDLEVYINSLYNRMLHGSMEMCRFRDV